MIGPVFICQRLSKNCIFCYFIKIWVLIFVCPKAAINLKNALYYPLLRKILFLRFGQNANFLVGYGRKWVWPKVSLDSKIDCISRMNRQN